MDSNLSSTSSFNNRLGHAQSTPAGVDGSGISNSKTPPITPKRSGKMLAIRVQMLDDTVTVFHVQAKAIARLLFDQVCKQLNLLEADYFGLEYQDAATKYWLDFEKPLHRQVGLPLTDPFLKFCVKFYTPDPAQLEEEYTRYLFCLQIKKDLMQGDLQCNDNTAALIISYIVQAECGDYAPEDYPDHTYLSSHKFVPHQDKELERKIMENHKKHIGQSPAEADLNLLETARRCELYGMKMHPAKDQEGVPLNISVAHMGIVVFQNCTKINTFSWAKIRKISFKRKRFLIKLHPEGYGYYKDVVEFVFDNRNQCKSFWKKCVENHGFFRCSYVKRIPRQKARVLSRGSSFRYSGKTQKQMVEYVRENYVKRQTFQRSQSFRYQNSISSSVVNVEASVSAHPLLPLGETTIAESGASLSCGSMTLSGSLSPTTVQDVGQQTAPIVTTQAQPTSVDVHEPATTSSDITSIASQSPMHDTGQKIQYQPVITHSRFSNKTLTNTTNNNTVTNTTANSIIINNSISNNYSGGSNNNYHYYNNNLKNRRILTTDKDFDRFNMYNYDSGKISAEYRSSMAAKKSNASTTTAASAAVTVRCKEAKQQHLNNDPDILKDLGKWDRDDFAWQRSTSCKELGSLPNQERLLKRASTTTHEPPKKEESLIRYDSIKHCYSCNSRTPSFGQTSREHSTDMRVYSSSYPGTTPHTSIESEDEPMPGGSVFVLDSEISRDDYQMTKISHDDDVSHDSYEILEKEDGDGVYHRSRANSVDSDEMFVMDSDYKSISKHILWREGSADVEKRLGYVEPRYRNIGFSEFNEICKRGFLSRRNASLSHGNIKFSEFKTKSETKQQLLQQPIIIKTQPTIATPSSSLTGHDSVSRTKSDPVYLSKQKKLNKQKLFGLHQKSFDLPPCSDFNDLIDDKDLSKSTVDIPYTLRIRNAMNGTARDSIDSPYYDDSCIYENVNQFVGGNSGGCSSKSEDTVAFSIEAKNNKSRVSDHASQDSGLSLSLGMESVDDNNDIDLKNVLLTKNYEQVVTTKKSTKLMLSLSEENNESVPSEEPSPHPNEDPKINTDWSDAKDRTFKQNSLAVGDNSGNVNGTKQITKVKSMEVTTKKNIISGSKIRKSRSAEMYDRKNSFLRTDSSSSRGKKEIIVIDSDDYHSFDDSRSDKRSDGSDSVIIVEYRGNKKKKLSKKVSSDSRGSQAESEASSFDAPRIKKKDLRKRNSSSQSYFYKDRIPTIEISEDETYKAEGPTSLLTIKHRDQYDYSSDERHASGSDLSKTEVINEIIEDNDVEDDDEDDLYEKIIVDHNDDKVEKNENTSDTTVKMNSEKNKNEITVKPEPIYAVPNKKKPVPPPKPNKSPIFARLGLSEGSGISQVSSKSLSPSATRRTKSLDTPIVSLNRLPPITSFSSKDDTVDNDEGVVLEEKTLHQIKNKHKPINDHLVDKQLNDTKNKMAYTEMAAETKFEIDAKKEVSKVEALLDIDKSELNNQIPFSTRLKSNSIAVSCLRKPSFDLCFAKENGKDDDFSALNKERSRSEGYEKNLSQLKDLTGDRKRSTRQERLDSFKKLKNFSIDLCDSDETEARKRVSSSYDDNVFEDVKSPLTIFEGQTTANDSCSNNVQNKEKCLKLTDKNNGITANNDTSKITNFSYAIQNNIANDICSSSSLNHSTENIQAVCCVVEESLSSSNCEILTSEKCENFSKQPLKLDLKTNSLPMEQLNEMEVIQGLLSVSPSVENKTIAPIRSFDEEPSSSSSVLPPEPKPSLESSGSSSVEEAILPPDYIDDEELPNIPNMCMTFDTTLGIKPLPGTLSSPFSGGFFSLSRTLSRISERSTTSEQERTDVEDDSTKPLSRSLSIDDSIISSDQHPSFSSDPPSGMNLENVFDEDDQIAGIKNDDKLDFSIPSPLLNSPEEEWPSPPHSPGSVRTPVIDNEEYSAAPLPPSPHKNASEEELSISEEKTLQEECEEEKERREDEEEEEVISDHEGKTAYMRENGYKQRGSIGDDTSVNMTISDWSSSTGTTVKQAPTCHSGVCKSEDNSLTGETGISLSTDMTSESRKSSTDDLVPIPFEKKYFLDRKQPLPPPPPPSVERKQQIFFPPTFHSFDEYDSPCTESEDTSSSPLQHRLLKKQPPLPPRSYQSDYGVANAQKLRTKLERNRAAKFLPHYTSSSMSTSLESPTSAERKFAKLAAKEHCYSYYSLARSPPSDGSSSSPEAPDTPLTPNTIPRVSKRRRNTHTLRRRQQRPGDIYSKPDYSTSPSSAHTPHTPKQFYYPPRRNRY